MPTSKRQTELIMLRNKKIVVGSTIGAIVLIAALVGIPMLLQTSLNPFGSGINFSYDDDFSLVLVNGTETTINQSFSIFGGWIYVVEFDDVLLDAYEKNQSGAGNFEDLLPNNINTYRKDSAIWIGTSNSYEFFSNLFEYINGTLPFPNATEGQEMLKPLIKDDVLSINMENPYLIVGMTLFLISDDFNLSEGFDIFAGDESDLFIFSTGFDENSNIINLNVQSILDSDFFVTSGRFDMKVNSVTFNNTDVSGDYVYLPLECNIDIEGINRDISFNGVPIIMSFFSSLISLIISGMMEIF